VPWDAVPSPHAKRAKQAAAQTVARERRRRDAAAQRRRRRAVAVLSAAGILAGGGGWVAVNGPGSSPAPTGAGPGELAPDEAARWAGQAEIVLASVTQQLDVVAQAQEAWNKLPESRTAGAPPAPVAQMLERQALLEQQRATLESQLAAWHSLDKVNGELASADQQLATVQKALDSLPQGEQLTSEQATTVKQLAEQRDVRVRQRDAKKQELDSLKTGVHTAVVTPLQDTAEKTKALADNVLGLVNGNAPAKPNGPVHEPTPGVANRDNQNRQRQDTDNSAPLIPGRPQAGASPNPGGVDGVAGTAGSLLPGGGETGGGTNAAGSPSRTPAAYQGSGEQTKARPDKAPAAERQTKDSRGTIARSGRLGGMASDMLPGAGRLIPGAGAAAAAAQMADAAASTSGAPQGSAGTYDPQSQLPPPRSGAMATPATTTPQSLGPRAAIGMARQVMPQFMPGAAVLADGAAASAPAQLDPSASSAPRQGSRTVTVDQLVDYASQRAMDEAQRRQAVAASAPASAATTTSPSSQPPAADQVPAQYQEMVSAWSTGR
jgi:hypothetical protein